MLLSLLYSNPLEFVIIAGALLASLTIHEFAHALIGDRLGDPTARLQGRVSLNPLVHLDPMGTLAILLVGFGWGKPVQFDPYNLKNPRRDGALIALAGPVSNLLFAIGLSLLIRVLPLPPILIESLIITISINVGLAIFNLIPIHPLDGGKILIGFAPRDVAEEWDELLERYGFMILLFLILPLNNGQSAVSSLVTPIRSFILALLV